ncbi:Lsr2 family protein [Glycomyces sp. NPDC047369]
MAKKTRVLLIDDIDGGNAHETVKFAIDGEAYEIDLSDAHAKELRDALGKFQEAATRLGRYTLGSGRGPVRATAAARPAADRGQNKAIREWAAQEGKRVSPRGRIPAAVVEAYQAAHG